VAGGSEWLIEHWGLPGDSPVLQGMPDQCDPRANRCWRNCFAFSMSVPWHMDRLSHAQVPQGTNNGNSKCTHQNTEQVNCSSEGGSFSPGGDS
jgi:hypothetical protein